jgi:hypothetical protein
MTTPPCGRLGWCSVEEITNGVCAHFVACATTDRHGTGDRVCLACWHLERCHARVDSKTEQRVELGEARQTFEAKGTQP